MCDVSWKRFTESIVEFMTDSLDEPNDRLSFSDQASILGFDEGLRKLLIDDNMLEPLFMTPEY